MPTKTLVKPLSKRQINFLLFHLDQPYPHAFEWRTKDNKRLRHEPPEEWGVYRARKTVYVLTEWRTKKLVRIASIKKEEMSALTKYFTTKNRVNKRGIAALHEAKALPRSYKHGD